MTDLADIDALDGLITPEVGHILYDLALDVPADRAVVEIGSYRGHSTAYLAAAARGPVYAVDPWELLDVTEWCHWCEQATRAQFEAQLAAVGLLDRVTVLQGLSTEMAGGYDGPPVGLLYVDGNHGEEAVHSDVQAWLPHVAQGALVVFDDYLTVGNPGVARAVDRLRTGPLDPAVAIRATRLAICTRRP